MFVRAQNADGTTIYGILTTEHAASSYGKAVLVALSDFGGQVYGPRDLLGYQLDCAIDADGNWTSQTARNEMASLAEKSGFVARKINGLYA